MNESYMNCEQIMRLVSKNVERYAVQTFPTFCPVKCWMNVVGGMAKTDNRSWKARLGYSHV